MQLFKVPSIVRCFSFTLSNLSLDSRSNLFESSSICLSFSNLCCCFSFCIIAWVMLTNNYEQKRTLINIFRIENSEHGTTENKWCWDATIIPILGYSYYNRFALIKITHIHFSVFWKIYLYFIKLGLAIIRFFFRSH